MAMLQIFPMVTSSGSPGAAAAKVWNALLCVRSSTSGRIFSWPARYSSVARSASIEMPNRPGRSSVASSSPTRAALKS
jgi:hypothetical protein